MGVGEPDGAVSDGGGEPVPVGDIAVEVGVDVALGRTMGTGGGPKPPWRATGKWMMLTGSWATMADRGRVAEATHSVKMITAMHAARRADVSIGRSTRAPGVYRRDRSILHLLHGQSGEFHRRAPRAA